MEENLRIIISGGGTGGHIFPAVSIANAIKEQHPCLLYTSPSPRDRTRPRMPSSA